MDEITDFLGTVIEPGALVVYASMVGRSPRLTLGEVIEAKRREAGSYYKYAIKVQPMADSFGSSRLSEWKYDKETKKGKFVERKARPVTLNFNDRIMVVT